MSQIQDFDSTTECCRAAARQAGGSIFTLPSRLLGSLYLWQTRINERREMASLDERMLKDAGTSREEILHETSKTFWRG